MMDEEREPDTTFWKCGHCGGKVAAQSPPEVCPTCGRQCEFIDVTCYTPECGGPGNINPKL